MLDAIIVDDERPAIEILKRILGKTGKVCVVGAFMRAQDALAHLRDLKPDVAFLDIEMPEMSGLELAEKIIDAGNDTEIVFVTAYDKYALEAFRVNAIDYILKPLSSDDIAKTITRLEKIKPAPSSGRPSDKGRIYCFGGLSVYGAGMGETVKWRTSKAEELFAFMLQNLNEEVAKWKITQVLWPDCDTENLNVNLYTTVYKVKKTLLTAKINFDFTLKNGRYRMELPDAYIDAAEFEEITEAGTACTAASVRRYERAFDLYRGNYLEENGYYWSQNKTEEYSKRYRGLVSGLAGYYAAEADYASAEKILRKALTMIPLDDDLNEMLLKLYFTKRDKASFVIHYKKVRELYRTELGIAPNRAMRNLFGRISDL